jgi:hypothetical protein
LPTGLVDKRTKEYKAYKQQQDLDMKPNDFVVGGTGRLGTYAPINFDTEPKPTASILHEADALINGVKEQEYGHPKKNLNDIANFWSSYLGAKFGRDTAVTATDVCQMMALLKMARSLNGPYKHDTILDEVSYVGLIGRLMSE